MITDHEFWGTPQREFSLCRHVYTTGEVGFSIGCRAGGPWSVTLHLTTEELQALVDQANEVLDRHPVEEVSK